MKGVYIKYSSEELQFIEARKTLPRAELTALFNKAFGRDIALKNICALCKRKGWMTGRTGQFKPGNVPSPMAGAKGPNRTSFRKGNVPQNHRALGSERTDYEGYVSVKVAEPDEWKLKHRMIWEAHHGQILEGVNIQFLDGDRSNCAIQNLYAVSREQNIYLNTQTDFSELPVELKPSMVEIAKVVMRVKEIEKRKRE